MSQPPAMAMTMRSKPASGQSSRPAPWDAKYSASPRPKKP